MGQISMEILRRTGSALSGNQHTWALASVPGVFTKLRGRGDRGMAEVEIGKTIFMGGPVTKVFKKKVAITWAYWSGNLIKVGNFQKIERFWKKRRK